MIGFIILAAAAPAAPAKAPPPAIVVPVAPPVAGAAAPAASAKALKLVELLHVEQTLDRMFDQLAPLAGTTVTTMLEANPDTRAYASTLFTKLPGGRARLAQIMSEEMMREMRKDYPAIKAHLAAGYDTTFSPAELDELILFYSSGVGAKILAVQPQLQAQMEKVGQTLGEEAGRAAAPVAIRRAEKEAGMEETDRSS